MKNIILTFLTLVTLTTLGQTNDFNYSRKICFTNFNGEICFDTNTNCVYSQIHLASSAKIKLNGFATSEQKKLILSHSENFSTGTYYSKPELTNYYLLTSTFMPYKDSFKLVKRQIEKNKDIYLKGSSNIATYFIVEDSSEFLELRKNVDTALLKFLPDNHVIIQTIYKDINGDSNDEILLASMSVYIGEPETIERANGPEEYLIQILSKTHLNYESVFNYSKPPTILKYVDLLKLKGQSKYSLILYGENCWRNCHPEIQILKVGNGNLDNCEKEFSY